MKNDYCLVIKDLTKSYGAKQALAGITLNLEAGEIVGLVGPNGSGKTTLIKAVMGLIQPTSGSIKIFGKEAKMLSRQERRDVGYIAEEPNLYEFMTVKETISFNRGFYPAWDEARCQGLLSRFHLPLDEKVKNLSRGMKTQLALVLALVPAPRLLMLDEPLEGLDPLRRIEFINLLLEDFMEHEDRSVVIASHYLEELERMADKIAFIHEGVLKRVAPMEHLRKEEKTIRVVFQKEPPETLFSMPGIKEVKREGKQGFLITVEDNFSAIFEACSRHPYFVLDIYHRNLEDLFQEYAGGNKDGP